MDWNLTYMFVLKYVLSFNFLIRIVLWRNIIMIAYQVLENFSLFLTIYIYSTFFLVRNSTWWFVEIFVLSKENWKDYKILIISNPVFEFKRCWIIKKFCLKPLIIAFIFKAPSFIIIFYASLLVVNFALWVSILLIII